MSNEILLYSNLLLWVVVLVLSAVVFGMVRQIGILHERVAPMGALANDHGPEVGDMAPDLKVAGLDGSLVRIGGPVAGQKSRLLLFVSPACPICKKLLPIARSFARGEKLDVVLVGDGDPAEQRAMISSHQLESIAYVNSPQVGMTFKVGKLPYAILIDEDGVIRAKGLVNSREHLESLAIAKETGYGSIQAYLKARGYVKDDGATQEAA
ncbi:MAG: methylamine dehydrogenase accessory protein MauD [Betaproteobacteria bacterium]|jgi:methylamine dehydrogenase accessory protein MauD|nr:methylamine dehydrogenase accessory protein MauD [Rhodocyclaceae bacterium]MCA3133413.1 methylamine dehydrogenase accessory protein MauD [Rhodocyclaceae bacterium]MCA3143244.1 methylamine dehydrogenase accessory protein MauD [Rhodocyclaceae bacterium]MCA3144626.1 methylamine dehydrogenase accessory protein MauD [Rhodocyclaceae bacterium]MCE2896391.1 methylamine dehydrogenase accessory protein MauD [Betaproteobacteria bacterium]